MDEARDLEDKNEQDTEDDVFEGVFETSDEEFNKQDENSSNVFKMTYSSDEAKAKQTTTCRHLNISIEKVLSFLPLCWLNN